MAKRRVRPKGPFSIEKSRVLSVTKLVWCLVEDRTDLTPPRRVWSGVMAFDRANLTPIRDAMNQEWKASGGFEVPRCLKCQGNRVRAAHEGVCSCRIQQGKGK